MGLPLSLFLKTEEEEAKKKKKTIPKSQHRIQYEPINRRGREIGEEEAGRERVHLLVPLYKSTFIQMREEGPEKLSTTPGTHCKEVAGDTA